MYLKYIIFVVSITNQLMHYSLISTGCDCCTTPPLYCTCTEAEYFLFSSRLVNDVVTFLVPSCNMFIVPEALTQCWMLQASTKTQLTSVLQRNLFYIIIHYQKYKQSMMLVYSYMIQVNYVYLVVKCIAPVRLMSHNIHST